MTRARNLLAGVVLTSLLGGGPVPPDASATAGSDRVADTPSWTETRAPVVLRPNTVVSEVDCSPTGTSCVAVGHRFDRDGDQVPAIQRWDGLTWRTETPPESSSTGLFQVACSTPTDCVAIEGREEQRGPTRRIAVRSAAGWRWIDFAATRPAEAFTDVFCHSATSCVLAGHRGDMAAFDGTSVRTLPRLSLRPIDLDCLSATYCAATNGTALAEWDGSAWETTDLADGEWLVDVGCWAEQMCLALGEGGSGETTAYSRSPDAPWHRDAAPPGRSVQEGSLYEQVRLGLDCVANDECHLLRATGRRRAPDVQLLTWHSGSWASSSVPVTGRVQALGCRPGECVVIDAILDPAGEPLSARALHGYGPVWEHRSMVNPRGVLPWSDPYEAMCPARDWCVGIGFSGVADEEYVVRRTGRRWIEVASPLERQWDVDCWRPGACVNAGSHRNTPRAAVLGAGTWQRLPALSPAWLVEGSMTGVSCVESLCAYTGYYRARHDAGYGVFVARREGRGWRSQRLGPLIEYDTWFDAFPSIDCPTASRCVVVTSSLLPRKPPTSHEAVLDNGIWRWRTVGHGFSLFDLDCADADHCIAGGSAGYPGLIMARGVNGRWRRVAVPTRTADFYSVSCPTSRECYVAGTGSRIRQLTRTPTGWRARSTGPRDMTDITCWAPRSCLTFNDRTAHLSR